jgi:hypothetical protein
MKDLFVAFLAMLWRHILQQRAVFCCHLMRWFYCGVQICCHFEVVERWQAAQMMRASQGHGRALCSSRPSFISCVCVSLLLLALSLSLSYPCCYERFTSIKEAELMRLLAKGTTQTLLGRYSKTLKIHVTARCRYQEESAQPLCNYLA